LSVIGAFLRYHRFELYAGDNRFRSIGGLFTRHVHSIRYAKIQSLVVTRNLVQRLFDAYKLSVRQAGSGNESAAKSFVVPLLTGSLLDEMTRESFGDEFPDADLRPDGRYAAVSPHYIRANVVAKGVLPALLVLAATAPQAGPQALIVLAWIPLCFGIYWRSHRQIGVRLHAEGLTLRRGFIGVRVIAHLYRKVQRVTLSQSPFQRRHRLATLRLYLASGTVRLPFLTLADAERLRDYILFVVETDQRAWH
ncbi:MAG: PH domain-containing protein, partial [Woeseiaceae bacterium]|nr:PH domain-containing protein [Woeseiaceae bacterium]